MTYREKLQMDYPGIVKKGEEIKECIGYYEFANGAECIQDCEKCWDREIPGTEDKEMTKADLKDGMVCERRDGELMLWINGALRGINDWDTPGESLKNEFGIDENDIVKIYVTNGNTLKDMLKRRNLTLIWERKERKEMTLADIERELGYPVKIVSPKN